MYWLVFDLLIISLKKCLIRYDMEKFWNSMHQEDVKTGLKVKHMYEQLHMNTKTVLRKFEMKRPL